MRSPTHPPAMSEPQNQTASDPYLELELYLEKVNEEIGKVLDQCLSEGERLDVSQGGENGDVSGRRRNSACNKWTESRACERSTLRSSEPSLDSLSIDTVLQDALEITVNDCYSVNTATQTSPTRSQSSSPLWTSDCSSSFELQSSSRSEHGDDTSSPDATLTQNLTTDVVSSDSELIPKLRHHNPPKGIPIRLLKKRIADHSYPSKTKCDYIECYGSSVDCVNTENPVWILRKDVKIQRKQRCSEDRRGMVFDEHDKWLTKENDGIDDSLNVSAHSLPLPQDHHNHNHAPVVSAPFYDRVSSMPFTDLGNKSSSAPVLKKSNHSAEQLSSHVTKVTKQPRSQSDRYLAEIQAAEACKWLKAAGFPQYAQMYEDHQFPIDLNSVQKDHSFLDLDSWQSLYRRLNTLNKCANIKVDSWRSSQFDDSDADENQCALSDNWTFQHEQRRWSRCRTNEQIQPLQNITTIDPPNSLEDSAFTRTSSERFRDGAKALLRRVESLKSRRRKRQNREGIVISGPQVADMLSMEQKIQDLNCVEIASPTLSVENVFEYNSAQSSPLPCSPVPSPRRPLVSAPLFSQFESPMRKAFINKRGSVSFERNRDTEALSDSECQRFNRKLNFNNLRIGKAGYKPYRPIDKSETSVVHSSDYDSDVEEMEVGNQSRASWHSLQRGLPSASHCEGSLFACLTCGQLQVLRKLALLKLTALIEKHCPTHKTGWNWELPKFIRKIKTPDYKDKCVFGVPLSVVLQRTGQPLPACIQDALSWLRLHAVDQIGIFRKSGVRSRIQILKTHLEKCETSMSYDEQQAYDVADMVKQYFRELPEALLTTKWSETLILIFQYVPVLLRGEAVSYVLLLMPNEHCEVLQTLLEFLQHISAHSPLNQMTASNLAMCFAPSLFYQNVPTNSNSRNNSVSPRRKKQTGVPDQKELSENKAAHDCLLYLIRNYSTLFMVSKDMLTQCNFTDMDESKPISLLELGNDQNQGWRGYINQCQHALIKESKEKNRGWIILSTTHASEVELAYKKVGDGHPLRLWRVSTEVEAPPREVLHRLRSERHIWDPSLIKVRNIETLDEQSEVCQYTCNSMYPTPSRDYCVLRSWRTDLPRGSCAIVETSIEHQNADTMTNSVRAIVLASRYLIEPCGSGKSRLMHLSRVDTMGRTPDWYNKNYGHICQQHLANIRRSFQHTAVGPESKV